MSELYKWYHKLIQNAVKLGNAEQGLVVCWLLAEVAVSSVNRNPQFCVL